MAIIYTYPIKTTSANRDDLILISDSADKNKTKQISVAKLPGGIDFVGVGGNGTAGKIPKWSTQYDLTDSSISEDSATGNIGVGTTTLSQKLNVGGSLRTNGNNEGVYFNQGTISDVKSASILYRDNGDLDITPRDFPGASTIFTRGSVGIGTTITDSILTVKAGADTAFITQTNTANSQKLQIGNAFSLYSGASGGHSAIASDTILAFATGNTESMRIIANGNIGIDNTAPSRKLSVGSGNQLTPAVPLTISNGFQSNWVSKLYFGDPADWYKIAKLPTTTPPNGQRGGAILKFSLTGGYHAPTTYVINYFKYWTAFVGSNAHTLKLEQYGPNLTFTKARISLGSDNEVYIEVYKTITNDVDKTVISPIFHDSLLGYDGYQAQIIASDATNRLPSGSSGGSMEELSFVIHGTSVKRLLVNGTINLNNSGNLEIKAAANDAGDIIFKKSDNGQIGRIWSRNDGVEGGLYLATSGITPQLLITDAGNVGIGNTGPAQRLDVGGKTRSKGLIIYSTGGVNAGDTNVVFDNTLATKQFSIGSGIVQNTQSGLSIRNVTDSRTDFYIDDAGKVGIGTYTPASKLEVDGGDIEVDDSASGLILHSPNNTRYRIKVANNGTLSVTAV